MSRSISKRELIALKKIDIPNVLKTEEESLPKLITAVVAVFAVLVWIGMTYLFVLSRREAVPETVSSEVLVADRDLTLQASELRAKYSLIAVISAAPGEITEAVTKEVLAETPSGIKVFTMTQDAGEEEKEDFLTKVGADVYLELRTAESGMSGKYGIYAIYDPMYYTADFGNINFADSLVRNVTTSVSGKALGLTEADMESDADRSVVSCDIPSTALYIGYTTNEKENELLQRKDYQGQIADGIVSALASVRDEIGRK